MLKGYSVFEELSDPPPEATEFCLHDDNLGRRAQIVDSLRPRVKSLSAHLPSFMSVNQASREMAFDDGRVDHFVAHITKRSMPGSGWKDSWKSFKDCGRTVLFENHNQDWHQTDQGICWPEEFKPLVDAGHSLCLDVGHILYASSFRSQNDHDRWLDEAERAFEGFLEFPIAQVHAHTVNHLGGMDHSLQGVDIGPWLKRIVAKNPGVALLVEVMDYSDVEKIAALERWLA